MTSKLWGLDRHVESDKALVVIGVGAYWRERMLLKWTGNRHG
jgi:hypothetical protein